MSASPDTSRNFLKEIAPGKDPNIDIVAVHGLNPKDKTFHAEDTWSCEGKLWLRDFLPDKLPRARILLFGYNSNVGFESSAAGVREQALNLLNRLWLLRQGNHVRPLLFIAHSLGGIVVKEALVQSKLGEKYTSICTATYGIAFFGTPHRGSSLAKIGDVFAKITRAVLRTPGNTFMKALKRDEAYAHELSSNFQLFQDSFKFISVYETRPLKGLGLIVDKDSATLGLSALQETLIGLDCDHKEVCKFSNPFDPNYEMVSENIVILANAATNALEEQLRRNVRADDHGLPGPESANDKSQSAIFSIPYSRNESFIGRSEHLEILKSRSASIGKVHNRMAIYGLGGVGKSQLTIEYAYWLHERYPDISIFWMHASSPERIYKSFQKLANCLEIEEDDNLKLLDAVKDRLSDTPLNWLMIIDNADDASIFESPKNRGSSKNESELFPNISRFLPCTVNGSIFITTRDKAAAVAFNAGHPSDFLEIKPMTGDESHGLIKSRFKDFPASDESKVRELAGLLDHLPLALVQAAAFMQVNSISVEEYLELLSESDETQMDLLCEGFQTLGRDADVPNAVGTTMMLTINNIKERQPRAIEILSLMTYLDRQEIPKAFIIKEKERLYDFTKAVGVLKAFSLLAEGTASGTYSLHRLVQLICRRWLMMERRAENTILETLTRVDSLYPDAIFENWKICATYLPHAQSILNFTADVQGEAIRARVRLQAGVAHYYWTQRRYYEAEQLDRLALEAIKKELGPRHIDTIECMSYLSIALSSLGRDTEALELDEQVLELEREVLGVYHTHTLTSMSALASDYRKVGRWDDAERLELEVLQKRRDLLGPDHPETLISEYSVALFNLHTDRAEEAKPLAFRVFEMRREMLGNDHLDTLQAAYLVAEILLELNDLDQAEKYASQTLNLSETQLGPNDDLTITMKRVYANVHVAVLKAEEDFDFRRKDEAIRLRSEVLEAESKTLGPDHPSTVQAKIDLADVYYLFGHYDEAEAIQNDVVETMKRAKGLEDADTVSNMLSLAYIWKGQGRYTQAIEMLNEIIHLHSQTLGPGHTETKDCVETLHDWNEQYTKLASLS